MKKLITMKDWAIMVSIMCLLLTIINIVLVMNLTEDVTTKMIIIRTYVQEQIKVSNSMEKRFRAEYPDYETIESYSDQYYRPQSGGKRYRQP